MGLTYMLLTGALSGLVSVLSHSVCYSTWVLIRTRGANAESPLQISDAILHALGGVALALLFWLSWGLAAIVDVSWWMRGLIFGTLCWSALALPVTINAWLEISAPGNTKRSVLAMASRWATTCVFAGLACAWSWERSF